jgi:hypothetical protein
MRFKDLTGHCYGDLVVQRRAENQGKRILWECKCVCGNSTTTSGDRLVAGKTKSCGCLRSKTGIENAKKYGFQSTHGMTKTLAFRKWARVVERCSASYHNSARYYDRGIKVCEEWLIFENFYADMGEPQTGMSIDRINNNLGYSKENCRWATAKTQANNRERTRFLNVSGEKIALMDWALSLGIKKNQAQYFFSTLVAIKNSCSSVSLWSE